MTNRQIDSPIEPLTAEAFAPFRTVWSPQGRAGIR